MNSVQAKQCRNCKKDFIIEADDLSFYKKMEVSVPTFCPDCRAQRRFQFRNERTLYKRSCSLCNKSIISLYPEGTAFPVYCHECWFSDKWDALTYGKEYDFSRPLFVQMKELMGAVPRIAIFNIQCTNSDYTNQSYNNKNTYLSFALRDSEDCGYITKAVELKNCFDSVYTHHSENLYGCVNVDKSYGSQFLKESEGCVDSMFLSNCKNCRNCIGGVNLRSEQYVFFGSQLTKEEFETEKKKIDWGSYKTTEDLRNKFEELEKSSIHKYAKFNNVLNSFGDHMNNAKNCRNIFDGFDLENCANSSWLFTSKEISDVYGMGGSEFIYDSIGIEEVNNLKFCFVTDATNYSTYTDNCHSSSNIFGCVGLRNKEYCILNKQYSKEEYEKMIPKIIEHMNSMPYTDRKGRVYKYGEFFSPELSPFAYNETIAQEYFPLTKEEAIEEGYRWRDPETRDYRITKRPEDLPDNIKDTDDAILKETIACEHEGKCNEQCTSAFRIIESELAFYRKMNLPLPRLCPNCRHYQRLKQRNPLKLWKRQCMCDYEIYKNTAKHSHHPEGKCPNKFETSYSPDRKEIVYCEQCYQAEVV